jgi:hypothetical protein
MRAAPAERFATALSSYKYSQSQDSTPLMSPPILPSLGFFTCVEGISSTSSALLHAIIV